MLHSKAVIQCRMSSTRLPAKALRVVSGLSILESVIHRVLQSDVELVVLATSTGPEDDALVNVASSLGVEVIRGDLDDVLSRYLLVEDIFPSEITVRVCADNPLVCPELIDNAVHQLFKYNNPCVVSDFMNGQLPFGLGVEASHSSCIKQLRFRTIDMEKAYREHLYLYYTHHLPQQINASKIPEHFLLPSDVSSRFNFSVDTHSQLEFVNQFLFQNDLDTLTSSLTKIIDACYTSSLRL